MIWLSALALALSCILLLLSLGEESELRFPKKFDSAMNADIVFIGSSITRHALPFLEPEQGYLEDGRSAAIVTVPGISEQHTTQLLAIAIDSGAQTVFLEINAYAHEYVRAGESAKFASISIFLSGIGSDIARVIKARFIPGLSQKKIRVRIGAKSKTKTLDVSQVEKGKFYKFQLIKPSLGNELQAQLKRAQDVDTEVLFFSPPRPEALVSSLGREEFNDLLGHIVRLASFYNVPVWHSATPWPDDHFMDINAHANELGRVRLQRELANWYEARQ